MTIGWRGFQALSLVLVIVACTLAFLTRTPLDVSPLNHSSTAGDGGRSSKTSGSELRTPFAQARGAFLERPLFDSSRRPAEVPTQALGPEASHVDQTAETVAAIAQPPEPTSELVPPRLHLLGIRRFAGETRALIADLDDVAEQPSWFGTGEIVQGWSVESVSSRTVTLRFSQSTMDLHLHEAGR